MKFATRCLLLAALPALMVLVLATSSAEPEAKELNEKPKLTTEWKSAKEAADFLLSLSPTEADSDDIPALIQQLGDDDFEKREKAAKSLERFGPLSWPELEKAKKSKDAELSRNAERCHEAITATWMRYDRVWTALRLLREEKDRQAIVGILAILPVVTLDMELDDFAWLTLEKVVAARPESLRELEPYLKSRLPARRAAAGCFLARHGTADQQRRANELLKDASPEVRLRTAQGLLAAGGLDCTGTLIELLAADPVALAWQAEELLIWWSDGQGPKPRVGEGKPEQRRACQAAWRAWHPGAKENLRDANEPKMCRRPGLFVAARRATPGHKNSCVLGFIGCDGETRWEMGIPATAILAHQVLWDGRIITSEGNRDHPGIPQLGHRITERFPSGEMVWSVELQERSRQVRRMIHGGTFLTGTYGEWAILTPARAVACKKEASDDGESEISWSLLADGIMVRFAYSKGPLEVAPLTCRFGRLGGLQAGERKGADVPREYFWETAIPGVLDADNGPMLYSTRTHPRGVLLNAKGEFRDVRSLVDDKVDCHPWPVGLSGTVLFPSSKKFVEVDHDRKIIWEAWPPFCEPLSRLDFSELTSVSAAWRKLSIGFRQATSEDREGRLRANLLNPQKRVRVDSIKSLSGYGRVSEKTVTALLQSLADPDLECQQEAGLAIRELKIGALDRLVPFTRDERAYVRRSGLLAILIQRQDQAIIRQHIFTALKDPDPMVRGFAARMCGIYITDAETALAPLCKLIESDKGVDPTGRPVWVSALESLAAFGLKSEPATQAVIDRFRLEMEYAHKHGDGIPEYLAMISHSNLAMEVIADYLCRNGLPVGCCHGAMNALAKFGPKAKRYLPILQKFSTGQSLRRYVTWTPTDN